MVCKTTSPRYGRRRGFTLLEVMIAVGLGVLVSAAVLATLVFSLRSYQALTNYQYLNATSRLALDTMSRDIRQATGCSTNAAFTTNSVTLIGANAVTSVPYRITFNYDSAATTLKRTYLDTSSTNASVLLSNCVYFKFSYFQRTPAAAFGVFSNDSNHAELCKVIQVDWKCSRNTLGRPVDTMVGESAKIVIRKE